MIDNSQKYFNQEDFWNQHYKDNTAEQKRLIEIINIIPEDVKSILDVGCGNGILLNKLLELNNYKKLVGIDNSEGALSFVKVERARASIDNIPFEDRSFDLVFCNEVLEHLKANVFDKALGELKRISRKYIIVTVPNNEDLVVKHKVCPQCGCHFHPYYHVRSFNKNTLKDLFNNNFISVKISEINEKRKDFPKSFIYFLNIVRPLRPNRFQICPQCEYQVKYEEKSKSNIDLPKKRSLLKKAAELLFMKECNKWIMSLYVRKEE